MSGLQRDFLSHKLLKNQQIMLKRTPKSLNHKSLTTPPGREKDEYSANHDNKKAHFGRNLGNLRRSVTSHEGQWRNNNESEMAKDIDFYRPMTTQSRNRISNKKRAVFRNICEKGETNESSVAPPIQGKTTTIAVVCSGYQQ